MTNWLMPCVPATGSKWAGADEHDDLVVVVGGLVHTLVPFRTSRPRLRVAVPGAGQVGARAGSPMPIAE